jgi:hypothetical protein
MRLGSLDLTSKHDRFPQNRGVLPPQNRSFRSIRSFGSSRQFGNGESVNYTILPAYLIAKINRSRIDTTSTGSSKNLERRSLQSHQTSTPSYMLHHLASPKNRKAHHQRVKQRSLRLSISRVHSKFNCRLAATSTKCAHRNSACFLSRMVRPLHRSSSRRRNRQTECQLKAISSSLRVNLVNNRRPAPIRCFDTFEGPWPHLNVDAQGQRDGIRGGRGLLTVNSPCSVPRWHGIWIRRDDRRKGWTEWLPGGESEMGSCARLKAPLLGNWTFDMAANATVSPTHLVQITIALQFVQLVAHADTISHLDSNSC